MSRNKILATALLMSAVMADTAAVSAGAPQEAGNGAPAATPVPPGHKEFTFYFRTEKVRNEKGEVIGEGRKHPDVKAVLPVPTQEDIINFIANGGKEAEFLMEVVNDAIAKAARSQINDWRENNADGTVTPDILDLSKLTFTAIANMPKSERGAPDIPEEVWNTFFEDYKTVIMATGKEASRVAKHVVLFKSHFRTCKYDKPALSVLKDGLNLWAAKTENMEDNQECYQFLMGRLEKYLMAEEKNLVGAL